VTISDDPALYVTGVWNGLPENARQSIRGTRDGRAGIGQRSWQALLRAGNPEALALALDLFLTDRSASRFGRDLPQGHEGVRDAALRLLDLPAIDGLSRFNTHVEKASHILALKALGFVAEAQDADALPPLPGECTAGNELLSAWSGAAGTVLRQLDAADVRLVETLSIIAIDGRLTRPTRTDAVNALAASPGTAATAALHDIVNQSDGDVQIEALAALARRGRLEDNEVDAIREILALPPSGGSFAVREADLRSGLRQTKEPRVERPAQD